MVSANLPVNQPSEMMDILSRCVSCGKCLAGCPIYQLTRREETSARAKLNVLKWYLASGGKPSPASAMMFFNCSQCLCCRDVCPAELPTRELFLAARRNLAGGGVELPAPWRWKSARKLWPLPAGRRESENGHSPRYPATPTAKPTAAGDTGPPVNLLLLVSPLLAAAAPAALSMTRRILRAAGYSHQPRCLGGPSWHQLYWRGDMDAVGRALQAATTGFPTGTPLLFAEPELGEICRASQCGQTTTCDGRRVVDFLEVLSGVAWERSRAADAFTVLPPPFPLDAPALQRWNQRWADLDLPGWRAFPDGWRHLRAEGLRAYYPGTARHLARALLETARAEGVRELVASSVRSLFWIQAGAPLGAGPKVTSLPQFLSRFLPA